MEKTLGYSISSSSSEKDLEKEYRETFATINSKLKLVLTLITGFYSHSPQIVDTILIDRFSIELYKLICQSISIKKRGKMTKKILVFLSCIITNIFFMRRAKERMRAEAFQHQRRSEIHGIPPNGREIRFFSDDEND